MHKAQVGSISSGTLRLQDLLGSFATELRYLSPDVRAHAETLEAVAAFETAADHYPELWDTETASDIVNCLQDYLQELAPPYCYFGTSEGDGADFGFWPSMESINELPRIQNVEGEDIPAEDHAYVNDHGNVTVYSANGTIILELV